MSLPFSLSVSFLVNLVTERLHLSGASAGSPVLTLTMDAGVCQAGTRGSQLWA